MHEIGELQRRISAALDRIGTGVQAMDAPATASRSGAETGDVEAALEDERRGVAELRDQLEKMEASHGRALAEAQALLSEVEKDRDRLKAANEALGEAVGSLRDANASGLSDAELINNAAVAELEALKVVRASDRAELDALIRLLTPVAEAEGETVDA